MYRKYHTLLTKPLDFFSSNVLVYSSVEALLSSASYFGWPFGIFLTASALRLAFIPLSSVLDKVTWKPPSLLAEPLSKLNRSFLLNDLESDAKNLGLNSKELESLQKQIKPSVLIRQMIQGYLGLGFARGISQVSLNPQFYYGIEEKYWIWSLVESDPFFLVPILSGVVTYQLLSHSWHPFTIKMSENFKFWISFGVSLCSVPLPLSYIFGYAGFAWTHLLLKKLTTKSVI
jgi:hypothetical protein